MPATLTIATALEHYAPLGILILIALVFGITNLLGPQLMMWLLGHSRTGKVKEMTYETGMNPFHTSRRRFNIRFYILAMTFLVFDVEIVFLFPWATVFPALAQDSYLAPQFLYRMLFFISTSVIAFLYAWRKGVFRFD